MLDGLSQWWNDVELWVARLPFVLQFTVVMAVLLPLCVGLAWVIDRTVDRVAQARADEPKTDD